MGWVRRARALAGSSAERENALHEWRRRRRGEPELPEGDVGRILVVCLGNICRSPFAAGLLASRYPMLSVRSAGFLARTGALADPAALEVAARLGVDLASHSARRLTADDVDWPDLILAMEGHQAARVARLWPAGGPKTRILGDFLSSPPFTIRDPWGQGEDVFEDTFRRIQTAVDRLCAALQSRGVGCSGGS